MTQRPRAWRTAIGVGLASLLVGALIWANWGPAKSRGPTRPSSTPGAASLTLTPVVHPAANQADDDPQGKSSTTPKKRPGARTGKAPFNTNIPAPEFAKDLQWLNTSGPVRLRDLRGKFVLLDFWTYCCINCMHVLPELKKLEQAYPNELVVIGVHSAKFEEEKDSKNIAEAILRYEIEHPVVNDAEHRVWDAYEVNSWPTIVLIDPEGKYVGQNPGEFKFEMIDRLLKAAMPYYKDNKLLDPTPIKFALLAESQEKTPLRFPGKVLADEAGDRLFIADSNHNRIVVTKLDGTLLDIIGSGEIGANNGDYATASFNHNQGMVLNGDTLYVADTENHMLRKVDLAAKKVSKVAGTGEQGGGWPGIEKAQQSDRIPDEWTGPTKSTPLNSPWDLWIHENDLYIAMAGPHQIWRMPLHEGKIGPFAGNGREDIVDGPHLPRLPYETGFASFAQPSGLHSDGEWLFVADSEGSSIRAVPFDTKKAVRTVIGTSGLPGGRLFTFGDVDGARDVARLQHCLGVVYDAGKLYVADTYNNKIKLVDATTGAVRTLVGTGKPGASDDEPTFDEPAGITLARGKLYVADTNNHKIRVVDVATKKVSTLAIAGLQPPKPKVERKPSFAGAKQVRVPAAQVKSESGQVTFAVKLQLPAGWKINKAAKVSYWLEAAADSGPVDRGSLGKKALTDPATTFDISVPVKGEGLDTVTVSMPVYYCQDGAEGVCKVSSVVFTVPLNVTAAATTSKVDLPFKVQ